MRRFRHPGGGPPRAPSPHLSPTRSSGSSSTSRSCRCWQQRSRTPCSHAGTREQEPALRRRVTAVQAAGSRPARACSTGPRSEGQRGSASAAHVAAASRACSFSREREERMSLAPAAAQYSARASPRPCGTAHEQRWGGLPRAMTERRCAVLGGRGGPGCRRGVPGCRTWLAPTIHTTFPCHAPGGGGRLDSRVRSASALQAAATAERIERRRAMPLLDGVLGWSTRSAPREAEESPGCPGRNRACCRQQQHARRQTRKGGCRRRCC